MPFASCDIFQRLDGDDAVPSYHLRASHEGHMSEKVLHGITPMQRRCCCSRMSIPERESTQERSLTTMPISIFIFSSTVWSSTMFMN